MKETKITHLGKQTYEAVIRGSIGTRMFRSSYARVNKKAVDITRKGELSCAFFVSSVLLMFGMIKEQHATVAGTVRDLESSGWKKVSRPVVGDVIVWAPRTKGPKAHGHIGFFVGSGKAISNNSKSGVPTQHTWDSRSVVAVYRSKELQ